METGEWLHLARIWLPERDEPWPDEHPFNVRALRDLDLSFTSPLTYLVGENGSGKTTLLEAIAERCDLPPEGGGRSKLNRQRAWSPLASAVNAGFRRKPRNGFFVRAENLVRLADWMESVGSGLGADDLEVLNDGGGYDLLERSHGEAFMAIFRTRIRHGGVILMDEPEAALSPQRQLALLKLIHEFATGGTTQLIIATHAPTLLMLPGATILSLSDDGIERVAVEDTSHYQITRGVLERPESYLRRLL